MIARRYKTRIKGIREINHLANNNIRAGAYLLIPVSRGQVTAKNPVYNKSTYKVKTGDSLWGISRKLGLSSKEIAQWNQIGLNSTLSLGQTLVVKHPTNSLHPSQARHATSRNSGTPVTLIRSPTQRMGDALNALRP